MPDGDSLNWKVRGRGSRKVLALIRSGADVRLIADEALKMFVKQANDGKWKHLIVGIDTILFDSLPLLARASGFSDRSQIIQSIRDEVRSLVGAHWGECAKWMISATARCVENLAESSRSLDRQYVRRELVASVVEGLLDNRVLHPIRQDVQKELGRDQSEQNAYEKDIRDATRQQAFKLVSSLFSAFDEAPVRSPIRSVPLRVTDFARLGESLTVLEGAL